VAVAQLAAATAAQWLPERLALREVH